MKLVAFYAAGLLMLCVMVFGGIEGFSFKLRVETAEFIPSTPEYHAEQYTAGQESLMKKSGTHGISKEKTRSNKLKGGSFISATR
ncbi:MAG: hypothetical protein K8S62_02570 [Candidatus Sabulitectum sp.]|nr:hypothetical protein [Candidatus Sabulitectum sp.]